MKYSTTLLFLAAATTTLAAPATDDEEYTPYISKSTTCTFGSYMCTSDNCSIKVCNIMGLWELVGTCPSGTACGNIAQNKYEVPACTITSTTSVPTATGVSSSPSPSSKLAQLSVEKRSGNKDGKDDKNDVQTCTKPGLYSCDGTKGIKICNASFEEQSVGLCMSGTSCRYLNNTLPFCSGNGTAEPKTTGMAKLPSV